MKKAEMIRLIRERIAEKYPQPLVKKAVPEVINEFFSILKEELKKGEEVSIPNFGIFKIREIKKEGEEVAKKVIRFIPSKK
ncbi:MAG: HU family DNA-binding protein [Caldimicrobium sp.]|nr:HU family DNA-binding protein [Caldimicrobium sp.]